jgi:energy-coupling factor transporter ATP-binding protein EcfA2
MDNRLQLGEDWALPLEALIGKRVAVLGKSGSGKTNTLAVLAAALLGAGVPVIVVDAMGQFAGLRQVAPVLVAGAEDSADVPLTATTAARLARIVFDHRLSVVLDSSSLPAAEEVPTIAAFLTTFWDLVRLQNPQAGLSPWALIIDEAQTYIPESRQVATSDALIDIAKRGRHRKLTLLLATQRVASARKDVLTQCNLILSHRVMMGQDVEFLGEVLPVSKKEIGTLMRGFPTGRAILVGDADVMDSGDDYRTVQIHRSDVLRDDGRRQHSAPSPHAPMGRLPDDVLADLRQALTEPTPQSEPAASTGSQPDQLHEVIRNLQQRLAQAEAQVVTVPAIDETTIRELEARAEMIRSAAESMTELGEAILTALNQVGTMAAKRAASSATPTAFEAHPMARSTPVHTPPPSGDLPTGAAKVLRTLVSHYPAGFTLAQVGLLTGYSVSGGFFVSNWKLLRERGLVTGNNVFRATEAALSLFGAERPRPQTLQERRDMWRLALPSDGHRRVFDTLYQHHRTGIRKVDLAAATNYEAGAGRFGEILSTLRNNNLMVIRDGRLFPNSDLYAEGQS